MHLLIYPESHELFDFDASNAFSQEVESFEKATKVAKEALGLKNNSPKRLSQTSPKMSYQGKVAEVVAEARLVSEDNSVTIDIADVKNWHLVAENDGTMLYNSEPFNPEIPFLLGDNHGKWKTSEGTYFRLEIQPVRENVPEKQPQKAPEKEPYEQTEKKENKTSFELGVDMGSIIKDAISQKADSIVQQQVEPILDARIKQAVESMKPTQINVPSRGTVTINGRKHHALKETLFLAEQQRQVFLAGPTGSGKTTLARQVAESFDSSFDHISCSAGMSEAHLLGRMLFDGTYVPTGFVESYENGGVFLVDEIDAADANTLLIINSAIANGIMSVPNRKDNPKAKRHDDFILLVAGNTWGQGSHEYVGREMQDSAFLDRFALSKVWVDYDEDLEKEITNEAEDGKKLYTELRQIRHNIQKYELQRHISTRAFVSGTRLLKAGMKVESVIDRLTIDWSKEERKKLEK